MTQETIEKLLAVTALMGEEMVEAVYQITGNEKISMAAVKKIIKKEKLKKVLARKNPSPRLAKEVGLSLSSVYRAQRKK